MWRGGLGAAYLLPTLFVGRCLTSRGPAVSVCTSPDALAVALRAGTRLAPESVATLPEAMGVLDGQYIGRSDQVSYTLHLFEQRRFRILLFGHLCNPLVVSRLNCCVPHLRSRSP